MKQRRGEMATDMSSHAHPAEQTTSLLDCDDDVLAAIFMALPTMQDRHAFLATCKSFHDCAAIKCQIKRLTVKGSTLCEALSCYPKGANLQELHLLTNKCGHPVWPSLAVVANHLKQQEGRMAHMLSGVRLLSAMDLMPYDEESQFQLGVIITMLASLGVLQLQGSLFQVLFDAMQEGSARLGSQLQRLFVNQRAFIRDPEDSDELQFADPQSVIIFASQLRGLKDLTIDGIELWHPLDVSALSSLSHLTTLALPFAVEFLGLGNVLQSCPKLHSLSLKTPIRLQDLGDFSIGSSWSRSVALTRLHTTTLYLSDLPTVLPACPSLQELTISHGIYDMEGLTLEGAAHTAAVLSACPNAATLRGRVGGAHAQLGFGAREEGQLHLEGSFGLADSRLLCLACALQPLAASPLFRSVRCLALQGMACEQGDVAWCLSRVFPCARRLHLGIYVVFPEHAWAEAGSSPSMRSVVDCVDALSPDEQGAHDDYLRSLRSGVLAACRSAREHGKAFEVKLKVIGSMPLHNESLAVAQSIANAWHEEASKNAGPREVQVKAESSHDQSDYAWNATG